MSLTNFTESGLNILSRQLELRIINLYYGTNAMIRKVAHPHYRLLFVLDSDGKSSFSDAEKQVFCTPGRWYLFPPFCEVTHSLNDTMKHLSIHFSASAGGRLMLTSRRNTFLCGEDQESVRRIGEMLDTAPGLACALFFRELCYAKLPSAVTEEDSERLLRFLQIPEYAGLLEFLNNRATAQTGINDMANFCKLTRDAFIKRFTRDAGMPPRKFLAAILTDRAAAKLAQKGYSVKETAAELEFGNAFYFSRFFRRQTGISPREFQQILQQKHRFLPASPANQSVRAELYANGKNGKERSSLRRPDSNRR